MPDFSSPFSGIAKDKKLTIQVLKDIANEELVHAGELLRLLDELTPEEAKLYKQGAKEVEEKIAQTLSH